MKNCNDFFQSIEFINGGYGLKNPMLAASKFRKEPPVQELGKSYDPVVLPFTSTARNWTPAQYSAITGQKNALLKYDLRK